MGCYSKAGVEEVVDMMGGWADPDLVSGLVVWRDQKKRKKKGRNQLTIAAHLTSYASIADKLHKNPYIARYTLL